MEIKSNLGQYFTTNNELKEKVFEFILNNPINILEPSIGQGDLVAFITDKIPNITFDMYEIDTKIKLLDKLEKNNIKDKVIYDDFMKQNITKKYKTIIGNPPYVRTKKGNLYINFTEKCFNLLDKDNGELIFIVPSDFLKLTSASKLLNKMMLEGSFTHIFHPHNEKMFENASIDVIIFRYCKNNLNGNLNNNLNENLNNNLNENLILNENLNDKKVLYNDKLLYIINSDGLITFSEENTNNINININDNNQDNSNINIMFKDYFDIYVGIVSGKEEVYKNQELGNINVLTSEDKVEKYIYLEKYPCDDEKVNKYLLEHKKELIERKIKKFNENNWFEWGAPRNIKSINKNLEKDCIYIYNLTRKINVAFLGKVNYFGGNLIMLKPKKIMEISQLNKIISYMNSNTFKDNFMFSKRFKIGHRQISNSYIPNKYIFF